MDNIQQLLKKYIVFKIDKNFEPFYTDDVSDFQDNKKYVYSSTSYVLTYPIGCSISVTNYPFKVEYNKPSSLDDIMISLRSQRDEKLKGTDIYLLEDFQSNVDRKKLLEYRKYLRDLPQYDIISYYDINNMRTKLIEDYNFFI